MWKAQSISVKFVSKIRQNRIRNSSSWVRVHAHRCNSTYFSTHTSDLCSSTSMCVWWVCYPWLESQLCMDVNNFALFAPAIFNHHTFCKMSAVTTHYVRVCLCSVNKADEIYNNKIHQPQQTPSHNQKRVYWYDVVWGGLVSLSAKFNLGTLCIQGLRLFRIIRLIHYLGLLVMVV